MEKDKVISIYIKLQELTKQNKIKWEALKTQSSSREGYQCVLGDYKILVYGTIFSETFKISDKNGLELGSLNDSASIKPYKIGEFMDLIHRMINKIDDKLDNFLDQLDKM